jgi:small subunit ribosomal protein S17
MARETRKKRQGRVVRNAMDKTVIVSVEWRQRHPLYRKSVRRVTRFFAHDGENQCRLGDVVRIEETRPISRLKHWRVVQIIERHEVAEVKPIELDRPVLQEVAETEIAPPSANGDQEAAALADLEEMEGLEDMDEDDAMLFAALEREQREAQEDPEDGEGEEQQR